MKMSAEAARAKRVRLRSPFLWSLPLFCVLLQWTGTSVMGEILTPPYFNLAQGRKIYASATCGEGIEGPELYCKLVGPTNAESDVHDNVIRGWHCDVCDPTRPDKRHPPEYAVDGLDTWWQSPPISRGIKYNEVNLTIDLGQEFHVAYVYVRMGNSPRPGLWILEKSVDYGKTFTPWQYFSDTPADCAEFFGEESLNPITKDDSVICSTEYSTILPLEGGEIPISILNNRPSANHYFNSTILQEWTRATNVRLRLLRTKNLLGHLMSVAREDPTVTRRYFYSIKDISIGGRCMCNGHADTCDRDPNDPAILVCLCRHNTCGPKCDSCCPGFVQKAWRQSKHTAPFKCEPCNCFNHTTECMYDPEVDKNHTSLDIYNKLDGGGVCLNCQHNTEGINCNRCKPKFYRPHYKQWNDIDVCQPCNCDQFNFNGNCAEGSGDCECQVGYTNAPLCDACLVGYYGYPNCKECPCYINATRNGQQCQADDGVCDCKENFSGDSCLECAPQYFGFPKCQACECNALGAISAVCDTVSGDCTCKSNYGGRKCDQCQNGYYDYPTCSYCDCDVQGTEAEICRKSTGSCICKPGYAGSRCDKCAPGFYGYPDCKTCNCTAVGSMSTMCDLTGKCPCLDNFAGRTCEMCSPGYYKYPECLECNCDTNGAIGVTCNDEGICECRRSFDGEQCDRCKEGFYNFPACEECNCNPAGVTADFDGCGSVPKGELCKCKERVEGRICDQCKPLYWNLNVQNPHGCVDCDCHIPGVLGGIAVCDSESGQCTCKPNVATRGCSECDDATYGLQEDDLFGCKECNCDVGGSLGPHCNKLTGQCQCQPRVTGRTCNEPLSTHYFPTLYQFQYELEDGRALEGPVRYSFNEQHFPNYSWKGYTVFNSRQRDVMQDIYILKSSVYRMVIRYVNNGAQSVSGSLKMVPDNTNEIEQKNEMLLFEPSSNPTFVTVMANGSVPFVLNPGTWTVHIHIDQDLFIDYFVLLPEEFYYPTTLNRKVVNPCLVNDDNICRTFTYPNISLFSTSLGSGAFIDESGSKPSKYYDNLEHLSKLQVTNRVPYIDSDQRELFYNVTVRKPGKYVVLVTYITPIDDLRTHTLDVLQPNDERADKIVLYKCPYTTACRQVVTDQKGIVKAYMTEGNGLQLKFSGLDDTNVGIQSVVVVPLDEWSLDYIQPRPICILKDGECFESTFKEVPHSKKIRFEAAVDGNGDDALAVRKINNETYVVLNKEQNTVDIRSKVAEPDSYKFVVHYYQPDFPEHDLDVLIQNGQFYAAKLPVGHCPSTSGCRALVVQKDGNSKFSLTENFVITIKSPENRHVYLNYLLVTPADYDSLRILQADDFDRTTEFITACGGNNFNIDTTEEGFCKDAVFSITAGYNNGALRCDCDYNGALSFECEKFGGQCKCHENVIGRQCTMCRSDYFDFPNCKKCNCPPSSDCHSVTGQCICPPRVIGEMCDRCEPLSFGFDPINPLGGCRECLCNPLGVEGSLQCDLENGQCPCKRNVDGRKCDKCLAGHFAYPYCQECECNLGGTNDEICDQQTAECFCKKFVTGPACDICLEGTFNLQPHNKHGCTECFCFGKTTKCYSSNLLKTTLYNMNDEEWQVVSIEEPIGDDLEVLPLNMTLHKVSDDSFGVDVEEDQSNRTLYFAMPHTYLGKRLTAYGGFLNFTLFYTIGGGGKATRRPDLILQGPGNNYLVYMNNEQPAAAVDYNGQVEMVESNFILPSGVSAKREHLMVLLKDIRGIYIRATYWSTTKTSRISHVWMDDADRSIVRANYELANTVEQCHCPNNYKGLSCEECAPGYYRISQGPHGGYCVACQCNGHATECDVNTGVCLNCAHNTYGDHCEKCQVGYHGNAMQGTPMDCLICACPLPLASNNFATGCEVSADGERISCDCIDGYNGGRCQSCQAGYYGRPDVPGDFCKPCNCSGNIDPDEFGSCDTVTGECLKCLHNTFGEACQLCLPGFFGDAINAKNCQACDCDIHGMESCNSYTGECKCKNNVVGDKCDRCADDHYGLASDHGCFPCDCGEASNSSQCDDPTGQCRCKPGVIGRTCDRCAAGYWNYSSEGCISCNCKNEYSIGLGCNAMNGQCECMPGVIGEKCDRCPHRWAFVPEIGCIGCDSCTDDLLDAIDELSFLIDPVQNEFDSVDSGFFTTRRLAHINDTIRHLRPKILALSPDKTNLSPVLNELQSLDQESKNMKRKAKFSLENSKNLVGEAANLRENSTKALDAVLFAKDDSENVIADIIIQSDNLAEGEGPIIDEAQATANNLIKHMKLHNLTERQNAADDVLDKVDDLIETWEDPNVEVVNKIRNIKNDLKTFNDKLDDLTNNTQYSLLKSAEAKDLYDKNGKERLEKKLENIRTQTKDIENNLKDSHVLNNNATKYLRDAKKALQQLGVMFDDMHQRTDDFNKSLIVRNDQLDDLDNKTFQMTDHANSLSERAEMLDHLMTETRNTSENAVKAATAYNEIIKTIKEAEEAATQSRNQATINTELLKQLETVTTESESKSSDLLDNADERLREIRDFSPLLLDSPADKYMLRHSKARHDHNAEQLKNINKLIENYQSGSLDQGLLDAMENADIATVNSKRVLDEVYNGFRDQDKKVEEAKELPKRMYETNRNILQVRKQLETVNDRIPEIIRMIDGIKPGQRMRPASSRLKSDLEAKINKLTEQIAQARDFANRIHIGLKFNPRTMVELRNPNNIADLSTSTTMSGYFKTAQRDGLLLFLGNGNGTNLRRTKSDDFMALQIANGYPTLTMDLGNGEEQLVNSKYVADDKWYQFIIDRTGLNAKLTIKEQLPNGHEMDHTVEQQLEGPYSIFNLDRNQSKLFVGSYPLDFEPPLEIRRNSFDGDIEELVVGDMPVSLWNFNRGYENNQGAYERVTLRHPQPRGYRFNGYGYVVLNATSHDIYSRSQVGLRFKTFASEGLIFLYGNSNDNFMSIELRNGKVLYKYNLGNITKVWHSPSAYNDGNWHVIEADRDGPDGRLRVDNIDVLDRTHPVSGKVLKFQDNIFIGGFPQNHAVDSVTNVDFDGCIDDVIIMGTPVDLTDNKKAYGVVPGCPDKFSRLVSFYPNRHGFIRKDNVTSANDFRINLKFKTVARDGLIFYATDRNQDAGISLSLDDGELVLISQKTELVFKDYAFNDNEWHVVSIRHDKETLQIDFDDIGRKSTDSPPPPLHILYGDIFIGGVPPKYAIKKGMVANEESFSGCITDTTVNGNILNFANATSRSGEEMGKCILDKSVGSDSDIHSVPTLPPLEELDPYATDAPVDIDEGVDENSSPIRGDGGKDSPSAETITETEHNTPPSRRTETTLTPEEPICALPLEPEVDSDSVVQGAYRYGAEKGSRLEYNTPRGKYRKSFEFSLEFRTQASDGLIFFASNNPDNKAPIPNTQFVALLMKNGYVNFMFGNSESPAVIESLVTCNDNVWHEVVFSREGNVGYLEIDGTTTEGRSPGNAARLDLSTPYYLGGVSGDTHLNAPSFEGCIKNFQMNKKPMENPNKIGVIPCSNHVEPGAFFHAHGNGYVKLLSRFKVGLEMEVRMDIKPRNLSGLLMAVHGKRDYFVLELDNGALKLSVDNGKGAITTRFQPTMPHQFCNGQWHSIQAVKSKSVVTLAVNGIYSEPGVGDHKSASTDTIGNLFLGGHRMIKKAKGITVRHSYVGCIKNVMVNGQPPTLITSDMVEGIVTVGSCPTN